MKDLTSSSRVLRCDSVPGTKLIGSLAYPGFRRPYSTLVEHFDKQPKLDSIIQSDSVGQLDSMHQ